MEHVDISGLNLPDAEKYREAVKTAIWRREAATGGGPIAVSGVKLSQSARGRVEAKLYPNSNVQRFDREPFASAYGGTPEELHESVYSVLAS